MVEVAPPPETEPMEGSIPQGPAAPDWLLKDDSAAEPGGGAPSVALSAVSFDSFRDVIVDVIAMINDLAAELTGRDFWRITDTERRVWNNALAMALADVDMSKWKGVGVVIALVFMYGQRVGREINARRHPKTVGPVMMFSAPDSPHPVTNVGS